MNFNNKLKIELIVSVFQLLLYIVVHVPSNSMILITVGRARLIAAYW